MSQLQRTAAGKIADAQNALLQDEKAKSLVGSSTVRQQEKEKYEKMVLELSESAPPALVTVIRYLAPLISWTVVALEIIVPVLYQLSRIISAFVAVLPLDIIFIGPDKRILNIADGVPYNETSVYSDGPAIGVLELNSGRARELGIGPGDLVEW